MSNAKPFQGRLGFDANNNKIINVAAPTALGDGVNYETMTVPAHSATREYPIGFVVEYNNQVHKAKTALVAKAFNQSDWNVIADGQLRADLADPTKGAGLIWFAQVGTGAIARSISDKLREFVSVKDFGAVGDGIVNDTTSIQNAHNSGKNVFYPPGNFKITSEIVITSQGQRIIGSGWGSVDGGSTTRIFATTDIKLFKVTAPWVHFEGFRFDNTTSITTLPHIHFAGDAFSSVDRCRFDAVQNFTSTGGGILIDDGAGGIGGSVANITNININHGSIIVKRSDVHIKNSWLWANSRPYAIVATGSVGNLVIEGCDLLPPQTLVIGRKAAVYFSGALSAPRLLGCNFDGNSSLSTGSGLLAENGVLNLLVQGCYGFGHDEDCIILDSIVVPHVIGNTFKVNNVSGNGSADIVLRKTFAQPLEKPLIQSNAFVQPGPVSGTLGAAVRVDAGTTRSGMRIVDNSIHQPGTGGGYLDIEINMADGAFVSEFAGSLAGNRGTRTHYMASGMASVIANNTFSTVSFGATMAYAPRPDQIRLTFASTGNGVSDYRFNSSGLPSVSSMGLGFPATHTAFDLYWQVSL